MLFKLRVQGWYKFRVWCFEFMVSCFWLFPFPFKLYLISVICRVWEKAPASIL